MGKPIENPIGKSVLEDLYVNQKLSAIKIASLYNTKPAQVYYLLNKYGIPCRSLTKMNTRFSVDESYFKMIDSPEKAYWLGFLYADGYVTKQHKVGLSLAECDTGHIEKFRAAIRSTHPVHFYTSSGYSNCRYARLIFSSEEMSADLQRLGCVQRKSLILMFPTEEQVPLIYLRDFVRGYFDGDGSITTGGKGHYLRLKICGTKEFLEGLRNYINSVIQPNELHTSLEKRHKDEKNNFSLTISPPYNAKRVLDELYKDSTVYLDRKYALYMKNCAITVEPTRNGGCLTL